MHDTDFAHAHAVDTSWFYFHRHAPGNEANNSVALVFKWYSGYYTGFEDFLKTLSIQRGIGQNSSIMYTSWPTIDILDHGQPTHMSRNN